MTEKNLNSTREVGCWSFNVAAGYKAALDNCLGKLKDAIYYLEQTHNETNAQKAMTDAQTYMDEAGRWFNRANNQKFRIDALISEIKVLRSGQGISYAEGQDPLGENWERESTI